MAAGLAGIGTAMGSAAQGYSQSKQQAVAERHQQAQDLYSMADRYSKYASQYSESDPQMYGLMWKAYSETMEKADKLVGEKGQGAWKAVRPLFAKFIPALQDQQKDDPHGTLMQTGPQPAQALPVTGTQPGAPFPGSPNLPQQPALAQSADGSPSGAPMTGTPPPAGMGAPAPGASPVTGTQGVSPFSGQASPTNTAPPHAFYEQMGNNPPQTPEQHVEAKRNKAIDLVANFAKQHQGQTFDEARQTPGFDDSYYAALKVGADAGVDTGKMIHDRLAAPTPMLHVTDGSTLAKIGLPVGSQVPLEMGAPIIEKYGPKEELANEYASLQMGVANGTIKPGDPDYKKFEQIRFNTDVNKTAMDLVTQRPLSTQETAAINSGSKDYGTVMSDRVTDYEKKRLQLENQYRPKDHEVALQMADQDGNRVVQVLDRQNGSMRAVYPQDPQGRKIPFKGAAPATKDDFQYKNQNTVVNWTNIDRNLRVGQSPDPELYPTIDDYINDLRLKMSGMDAVEMERSRRNHPFDFTPRQPANTQQLDRMIAAARSGQPSPPPPTSGTDNSKATPPPSNDQLHRLLGINPPPTR